MVREKNESACKPGSVLDGHSSRPGVAARLKQPTRAQRGPRYRAPIWSCSRWGLPCRAALAPHAVRSYRTVSPLPRASDDAVRRSVLCCTFRRLAPPRRYLAPCPVEPGLSSRPCDRATVWPTPPRDSTAHRAMRLFSPLKLRGRQDRAAILAGLWGRDVPVSARGPRSPRNPSVRGQTLATPTP